MYIDFTLSLPSCSVEAIYPIQNPNALQDSRVNSIIQYAMKVEKTMFEVSSSREEYYRLLAEKIYRVRKELEERRRIKIESDKKRLSSSEGGIVACTVEPLLTDTPNSGHLPYNGQQSMYQLLFP